MEYSLDLVWRNAAALAPVDEALSRQAIFTVQAPTVAKFLGQRFPAHTDTARGSDFHTRVEGPRGKPFLGPASLKLYDKRGQGLRLECTVPDGTFFRTTARRHLGTEGRLTKWRRSRKASSACATCTG